MKRCPICNRTYTDETLTFCLADGSILSAPHDPLETQHLPAPRNTDPAPTEVLYPASKPADSAPYFHPTISSPPPPFYSGEQPFQSQERSGNRTGRVLMWWMFLGVVIAVGIIVGVMWLSQERPAGGRSESRISNTNKIATSPPTGTDSGGGGSRNISVEYDTDRPGADYKNYDLQQPRYELCRDVCASDAKCMTYTYVKPGVQGPNARCWLKSSVSAGGPSNCCISGVKR